ncbi:FlgD immunoglobulin-like domain containing protein [Rufibacter latericius]|uniref:T9SS C-terminal target domain-containing protein n=1 Tax=Rufibacter latericius TaxID=2487040 RepID=A0A3M9MV17_9BACT|nr:FlgD immunoglobulin-like domain containing protein [Rufibacter latericius]RNI28753.1 T9SS C-terminal target domain-containing protein [Rufibacter latericius]
MERVTQQRQFLMSGALLLFFGALLYVASFQAFKGREPHLSVEELKEAGRFARSNRLHKKGAIGTKENPNARQEYELERLKDPATGKIPEGIRELELAYSKRILTAEQILREANPYGKLATYTWDRRGPYNVGGRTRALAIDLSNEANILAGGVSGGMWRSSNGGDSWTKVTDPNMVHSVTTVAQDRRVGKRNVWYYGTGEMLSGNSASKLDAFYLGNGVFKSIDNGVTWNVLPSTQVNDPTQFYTNMFQITYRVATNPANATQDEVFAATAGSIRRSINGGATWTHVLGYDVEVEDFNASPFFTDIAIGNNGSMYATLSQFANGGGESESKGIYRSTNGTTWTDITPTGFPETYERIVLDIAPSNENIVYFLVYTTENPDSEANLWKYEYVSGTGAGEGGVWTDLSDNLPMLGGNSGDLDLQGGYNMVVRVKPNNPNYVVLGGTNLYRSTSGFSNTTATAKIGGYVPSNNGFALYEQHHPDQHEVAFFKGSPNKMISAHDGGLSKTENNLAATVEWESLNRGYQTTQFYTIAMDLNTTSDLVVGGMQDNGSWAVDDIESQATWVEQLGGDGAFAAVTTHSILVSAQSGTVYRIAYDDAGDFQGYARIDPPKAKGYLFVNPYTIDPNNEYTMYLPAGDTLWRNKDISKIPVRKSGAFNQSDIGWEVVSKLGSREEISAVAVSKSPANVVYFGTRAGKLYKFQDGTVATPTRTNITGTGFPTGNIQCIAIDPRNADKAIVVFSNYKVESLFYTANGGTSWTPISGNLEENGDVKGNGPSTRWVTILPNPDGTSKFLVGTSTGLYSTGTLSGRNTTWVREGTNTIGQVPVDMVLSRTTDDLVLVGTHGNGVYSRRYSGPLASKEEIATAAQFGLKQNYPNPFRQGAVTTIPFNLERAATVKLTVYDLSGRTITTLVNGRKTAGQHQVTWDGRTSSGGALSSGTYLYELTIDGKRYTKRLTFLR